MPVDSRRDRLEGDGLPPPEVLDAWEVPEPAPDLADRMFEEPPTMHPTPTPSRRPLQTMLVVGLAVAACLVAAFWLGRRSVTPPPQPNPTPSEVPVVAPACPPPPECPPPEVVEVPLPFPVDATPVKAKPSPPPKPKTEARPKPPAKKTATLRVATGKGYDIARVYVDGVYKGRTPLPNIRVTPGRHKVRFKWPDQPDVVRRAVVKDGASLIVRP